MDNLKFYNGSTQESAHNLPCKVSCLRCGSLIMDEGRNMALMFPTLLSLNDEDKENFEVQYVQMSEVENFRNKKLIRN